MSLISSASRRNTVLPETLPIVAKKSTAGVKRGAYKRRDEGAKCARITIGESIGDGKVQRSILQL